MLGSCSCAYVLLLLLFSCSFFLVALLLLLPPLLLLVCCLLRSSATCFQCFDLRILLVLLWLLSAACALLPQVVSLRSVAVRVLLLFRCLFSFF